MIRFEVLPAGKRSPQRWKVTMDRAQVWGADTQAQAIALARPMIDTQVELGHTVTLKIKRPDGTIREERTYPRSADPRGSKG